MVEVVEVDFEDERVGEDERTAVEDEDEEEDDEPVAGVANVERGVACGRRTLGSERRDQVSRCLSCLALSAAAAAAAETGGLARLLPPVRKRSRSRVGTSS